MQHAGIKYSLARIGFSQLRRQSKTLLATQAQPAISNGNNTNTKSTTHPNDILHVLTNSIRTTHTRATYFDFVHNEKQIEQWTRKRMHLLKQATPAAQVGRRASQYTQTRMGHQMHGFGTSNGWQAEWGRYAEPYVRAGLAAATKWQIDTAPLAFYSHPETHESLVVARADACITLPDGRKAAVELKCPAKGRIPRQPYPDHVLQLVCSMAALKLEYGLLVYWSPGGWAAWWIHFSRTQWTEAILPLLSNKNSTASMAWDKWAKKCTQFWVAVDARSPTVPISGTWDAPDPNALTFCIRELVSVS